MFLFTFLSFVSEIETKCFLMYFVEVSMGIIFNELWTVLLHFLVTDGSSFIHEAFTFSTIGFLKKLGIVLLSCSAIDDRLSMKRQKRCVLPGFRKVWETLS